MENFIMNISECDTSEGLEHKTKKRKLEQSDNDSEDNNMGNVDSGSVDMSSMTNILSENDPAPDAMFLCSKLESETGQTHPKICKPGASVHEQEHDDDQRLFKDIDTEHENINGSGSLILNAADRLCFNNAFEDNNIGNVHFEDVSSMDNIPSEKDSAPDAMLIKCSKLESETGQTHPEIYNSEENVHEKEHGDDQKLVKDIGIEHENINVSGNLILITADVQQNVASFSVEMEEPSSTNACKEDPRISEDLSHMRGHDDHGYVANVAQELSKEMIDTSKDHSREKFFDHAYQLPCNEQKTEQDASLESSDIDQISGVCGDNASENIVECVMEEASACCSVGDHDDEAIANKEWIVSTPPGMPPELENAGNVKQEVVCFSASGESSSGVDANTEGKAPSQVLDTLGKGDSIGCSRKKLLVLDVNGLLADFICYVPYGYKPDIIIGQKAVFKRPFCDDFIKFCFERFEVGVWSSRTRRNVDMVIDFLMRDFREKLLFCWDQSHCTETSFSTVENKHKPLVLKEIRKLWKYLKPREFNASNTLLLDDSPHKALCNPANTAIFPVTFRFRDTDDTSLGPGGALRVYLEGLSMAENVQKYVEQNPFGQRPITEKNPSWKFYRRIIYFVERQNDRDNTNSFEWH